MSSPPGKKRVLILCTANSCRSQLAEALWRHEAGDRWDVFSAGVDPKGINPLTRRVLQELSISLEGHRSKHVREFAGQRFDLVITVCDHAREVCPVFPALPARNIGRLTIRPRPRDRKKKCWRSSVAFAIKSANGSTSTSIADAETSRLLVLPLV